MANALHSPSDKRRGFYNTSFRLVGLKPLSLKHLGWLAPNGYHPDATEPAVLKFDGWSSANESRRFDPSAWLYLNSDIIPVQLVKVTHGINTVRVWLATPNMRVKKFKVVLSAVERSIFLAWVKRFDRQQHSIASRFQSWLKAAPQQ